MPAVSDRRGLAGKGKGVGVRWTEDVLLLSDPLAGLVESVGADDSNGEEVVGRAETARGEVALGDWGSGQLSFFPAMNWQTGMREGWAG